GALRGEVEPSPPKADVYAFGCLAFETLTRAVLFDSESEVAQIALHLAHDGLPPGLKQLTSRPELALLVELLFTTLRRDPAERPSAARLRKKLGQIVPAL